MDYFDVLKQALKIAWTHKRLWVLGFFVAGAASVPSPSYMQTMPGPEQPEAVAQVEPLVRWAEANPGLLAALAGVLAFVGLVLFVLSIAAHGGLVWAANEAAEGRSVRLADAWGAGFSRWGRTFMIGLCLLVPTAFLVGALVAAALVPALSAEGVTGEAAAAGVFGTVCCGFPILFAGVVVASVLVGLLFNLAVRYGVLEDMGFGASIKAAWSAVWGKRGVWTMWLVMLLPGLVFGAAVGVVALLLAAPAAFAFYSGQVVTGAGIFVLVGLVLAVPQAAFSTFVSSAWTVFFRRMTGMEQAHPAAPPAYPSAPQAPGAVPAQAFGAPPPPPAPAPGEILPPPPPPLQAPPQPPAMPEVPQQPSAAPEVPPDDGRP